MTQYTILTESIRGRKRAVVEGTSVSSQMPAPFCRYDFFVHQNYVGGWSVSEKVTGYQVAQGESRSDAIAKAIGVLFERGEEVLQAAIEAQKIKGIGRD